MTPTLSHTATFRVYYEDTDAGGVMYYANYLKFAERARTELLRSLGISQSELSAGEGIAFVVRRCEIDYKAPARLDDLVTVETLLHEIGNARMTLRQAILNGTRELAGIRVDIVSVNAEMKPVRLPEKIKKLLVSGC